MIHVDVRVIAATHRNLEALVAEAKFREDLYYRLAVIPITVPPLRSRTTDIPDLVQHFFQRSKIRYGRPNLAAPDSIIPFLLNYLWPGNVRELENIMERLVLLSRSDEITAADLPEKIRQSPKRQEIHQVSPPGGKVPLRDMEHDVILHVLKDCHWNQSQAARELGISRKTLLYRMRKHGLSKEAADGTELTGASVPNLM